MSYTLETAGASSNAKPRLFYAKDTRCDDGQNYRVTMGHLNVGSVCVGFYRDFCHIRVAI